MNSNQTWQQCLRACYTYPHYVVKPRGMEVRELIGVQYRVPMPAYIDLKVRKVALPFMFAEPWWILSGSNYVEDIEPYMKRFKDFSDDQVFMRGAYGPKVVDQLPYILETLKKDHDSRQAVMTIWRERPGSSLDIPCTVSMQFFIRDKKLQTVVYMRSNDVVFGFTYDIFTFSMISKAVQLLLKGEKIDVELGTLTVDVGSLHLYQRHYEDVDKWYEAIEVDSSIKGYVDWVLQAQSPHELTTLLKEVADKTL